MSLQKLPLEFSQHLQKLSGQVFSLSIEVRTENMYSQMHHSHSLLVENDRFSIACPPEEGSGAASIRCVFCTVV